MKKSYVNDFTDTVKIYTNQLRKLAPVDRELEQELVIKAQKGDIEAQNKLVKSHLKFVVKVAKEFTGRGVALEDLIAEGNLGLIKSIYKFKPKDGYRLLSYGIWWIKAYIQQAIKNYNESSYFEVKEDDLCRGDNANDLIEGGDENVDKSETFSFATEIDNHIEDIQYNQKEVLNTLFNHLTDREQYIISAYFGLEDEEKTLDEIGAELNLSIERVRQCKEMAIKKMRSEILCLDGELTHIFV